MLPADGTIAARVAHWEFGISRRQLKLDYTRGAPAKRRLLPGARGNNISRQSFMQFGKFLVLMRTNLDGAFAIDQDLFVVGSTIESVVQTTFRNSVPAVSAGAPFRVVHFCPG